MSPACRPVGTRNGILSNNRLRRATLGRRIELGKSNACAHGLADDEPAPTGLQDRCMSLICQLLLQRTGLSDDDATLHHVSVAQVKARLCSRRARHLIFAVPHA